MRQDPDAETDDGEPEQQDPTSCVCGFDFDDPELDIRTAHVRIPDREDNSNQEQSNPNRKYDPADQRCLLRKRLNIVADRPRGPHASQVVRTVEVVLSRRRQRLLASRRGSRRSTRAERARGRGR